MNDDTVALITRPIRSLDPARQPGDQKSLNLNRSSAAGAWLIQG
jgi:hypothetical protein